MYEDYVNDNFEPIFISCLCACSLDTFKCSHILDFPILEGDDIHDYA